MGAPMTKAQARRTLARLYARVSTKDQTENFSLAAQRARMEAYCDYQGWDARYYDDPGISGARDDRPGLTSLLLDLERGDVVVVHALSRLGRGGAVQLLSLVEQIKAKGARLVSLSESIDTDTPTGRLMLTILAAVAELELEQTRERTEYGRLQAVTQGIFPHSNAVLPTGYKRGEDGRLTEDEHADAVRLVFDFAPGRTYHEIAEELNSRGIPTPRGARWSEVQTRRIILTEVYWTGVLPYRKEARPNDPNAWMSLPVPPLVSEAVWRAAQRSASQASNRADPTRYPLTGHVRCRCGTRIQGHTNNQKNPNWKARRSYRCLPHVRKDMETCPSNGQRARSWDADRAEESAREVLARFFEDPTDPGRIHGEAPVIADPYREERAELERKLDVLVELYLDGGLEREKYEARRATLRARVAELAPPPVPVREPQADLSHFADAVRVATNEDLADLLDLFDFELTMTEGGGVSITRYRPLTS